MPVEKMRISSNEMKAESTMRCLATSELSWLELTGLGKGWTGLHSIAMLESEGVRDGKPRPKGGST